VCVCVWPPLSINRLRTVSFRIIPATGTAALFRQFPPRHFASSFAVRPPVRRRHPPYLIREGPDVTEQSAARRRLPFLGSRSRRLSQVLPMQRPIVRSPARLIFSSCRPTRIPTIELRCFHRRLSADQEGEHMHGHAVQQRRCQ